MKVVEIVLTLLEIVKIKSSITVMIDKISEELEIRKRKTTNSVFFFGDTKKILTALMISHSLLSFQ